jgi:hypothetical protein
MSLLAWEGLDLVSRGTGVDFTDLSQLASKISAEEYPKGQSCEYGQYLLDLVKGKLSREARNILGEQLALALSCVLGGKGEEAAELKELQLECGSECRAML